MRFRPREPEPPSPFLQAFEQCQSHTFQAIPDQPSAVGYGDVVPMEVVCPQYPEGSRRVAVVDELRLKLAREAVVHDVAQKLGCAACPVHHKPWEDR